MMRIHCISIVHHFYILQYLSPWPESKQFKQLHIYTKQVAEIAAAGDHWGAYNRRKRKTGCKDNGIITSSSGKYHSLRVVWKLSCCRILIVDAKKQSQKKESPSFCSSNDKGQWKGTKQISVDLYSDWNERKKPLMYWTFCQLWHYLIWK